LEYTPSRREQGDSLGRVLSVLHSQERCIDQRNVWGAVVRLLLHELMEGTLRFGEKLTPLIASSCTRVIEKEHGSAVLDRIAVGR
jgi:hypothetical protein